MERKPLAILADIRAQTHNATTILNLAIENGASLEAVKELAKRAKEMTANAKKQTDDLEQALWVVKNSI